MNKLFLSFIFLLLPISVMAEITQEELEGWESFNRPLTEAAIASMNEKREIVVNGRAYEGTIRVNSFGEIYRGQIQLNFDETDTTKTRY